MVHGGGWFLEVFGIEGGFAFCFREFFRSVLERDAGGLDY